MARKPPKPASGKVAGTVKDRSDAWKALKKFRELQPQLTNFARSITGNSKLQIQPTHLGPYTRGNTIFLRPPLGLGRDYGHDRSVCGRRGNDGRQACDACRVREVIDFYLYHEIGHVWLGTQDEPTKADRDLVIQKIREWHPDGACDHAQPIIESLLQCNEVIGVADHLSTYVNFVFNGLEDARVNEGMFEARPGLRRIFDVSIDRMMSEGLDHADGGETSTWHDKPADSQFMVGLSIIASGYDPSNWFHSEVIEALKDDRLIAIATRARNAESVHEVLALSVQAFEIAQEIGYCLVPKCQVKEDKDQDDDGESGQSREQPEQLDGAPPPSPDGGGLESSEEAGEGAGSSGDGVSSSANSSQPADEPEDPLPSGSSDDSEDSNEFKELENEELESSQSPGRSSSENEDPADKAESTGSSGNDQQDGTDDSGAAEDGEDDSVLGGGSAADGDDGSDISERQSVSSPADGDSHLPDAGGVDQDSDSKGTNDAEANGDGDPGDETDGGNGATDGLDPEDTGSLESDSDVHSPQDSGNPWDVDAPEETGAPDGPLPQAGTLEDVEAAIAPFLMHGTENHDGLLDDMLGEELDSALDDVEEGTREFSRTKELIMIAISQVAYFDEPSANVAGVEEIKFPSYNIGWIRGNDWKDFSPTERVVGAAVHHARRAFEENKRSKLDRNRTSGRVNTRVLAKRAPVGDDRLFAKKSVPKKKSYLVIITGDCSGSTQSYQRNAKIKRAMMAQGDVLHRVGVPFVMLGHSAARAPEKKFQSTVDSDYYVYSLLIKAENEGWGPNTKERLAGMVPVSENLDGHTLEYCRKIADKSMATDVIIIYYTDGEMPASNYTEERRILEQEIKICKNKNYHLLAVGINTSSPERYGMKTVQMNSDEDIVAVIKQLEEELTK